MSPVRAALEAQALSEATPVAFLFDLDGYDAALSGLRAVFPADTLHTVAIKANPVGALLRRAVAQGHGVEAASAGELALALRVAPPERILLDSPCKSRAELAHALAAGVHVNLDSLQEVARVADLGPPEGSRVGLRVNPVVGAGRVLSTSTAMAGSKFGVDLGSQRDEILAAFRAHPWLTGLHVHVGSAGCDLELLARGVAVVAQLALEIESVTFVDIGGGLPIEPEPVAFGAYAEALRAAAPSLFDGRWRLATEFGRRIFGPSGVCVSRVEYTKVSGSTQIAVTHAGADLFVRAALTADNPLRITVLGPDGSPKTGEHSPWDIAGPLCFSGDLLARGRALPPIAPGDWLVVHDAGAYSFSHSTRYNSRPLPAIWGHRSGAGFHLLRPGQTLDEIVGFWDPSV